MILPPKEPMSSILLVEDDRDSREALAFVLEDAGHTVASAGNGREALELLDDDEKPDLILLDLMMPVMNGWEFLGERKRRPVLASIPVMVLTAAALDDKLGDFDVTYVRKPVDGGELVQRIGKLR
jgi:CheY-like chemotaxis protein